MQDQGNEKTGQISDYQGHFALRGKEKGCSRTLRGKVCIVVFLVHEAKSAWTATDIEKCRAVIKKVQEDLQRQSGLSKNRLHVAYALDVVSVQLKFDRDFYSELESAVLKQYGNFRKCADYQVHYEKKFLKDEAPVIFVLNRNFRSFAITSNHGTTDGNEASYLSFTGDVDRCARTMTHELLHQFGAIDYYLPPRLETVAQKYFPDSIMHSGTVIDPLTRYLIGWDEEPQETVLQFLEETKDITEEEIREARRKDDDNDW